MDEKRLYMDSGYVNIAEILAQHMTFNFVVGGRGTGKTFTALDECLAQGIKFIFMRRTQTAIDSVASKELSPFRPINALRGINVEPTPINKSAYSFAYVDYDDAGKRIVGETLGYGISLSTVSNLRGFNLSDAELLIFDEFIPETHERPIKNESDAFFNCYETINRNRELEGKPALQVLCLANANDFANPLFIALGLVSVVENMLKSGKQVYINPQRSICICLLQDSPISKRKADTALYRVTSGTSFSEMAISNAFAGYDDPMVKPLSLGGYVPYCKVGEVMVYKHKSDATYYVTGHASGTPKRIYGGDGIDLKRFQTNEKFLLLALLNNRIYYETHLDKALLQRYYKIVV